MMEFSSNPKEAAKVLWKRITAPKGNPITEMSRDRLIEADRRYQEHPNPQTQTDRLEALRNYTNLILNGEAS